MESANLPLYPMAHALTIRARADVRRGDNQHTASANLRNQNEPSLPFSERVACICWCFDIPASRAASERNGVWSPPPRFPSRAPCPGSICCSSSPARRTARALMRAAIFISLRALCFRSQTKLRKRIIFQFFWHCCHLRPISRRCAQLAQRRV